MVDINLNSSNDDEFFFIIKLVEVKINYVTSNFIHPLRPSDKEPQLYFTALSRVQGPAKKKIT